jgi:O-acetyl-ADP-ribose deacetylase (regulator of RNase III)
MKIRYEQGDLIASDHVLIVHGCNARGRYASGIAGVIRERLPFAYHAYRDAFDDIFADFTLGDVIWGFNISKNHSRIVGNLITQDDYGRQPGRVYVSYEAVTKAIHNVNCFVCQTQDGTIRLDRIGAIRSVGFPLIGAGLGGGSWKMISQIIETESQNFEPVVYTLDGTIPTEG